MGNSSFGGLTGASDAQKATVKRYFTSDAGCASSRLSCALTLSSRAPAVSCAAGARLARNGALPRTFRLCCGCAVQLQLLICSVDLMLSRQITSIYLWYHQLSPSTTFDFSHAVFDEKTASAYDRA